MKEIHDYNGMANNVVARVRSMTNEKTKARVNDFWAYMPQHRYLHVPTRELWPKASVDGRVVRPTDPSGRSMSPSRYLDRFRSIEQLVWAPDKPAIIEDHVIDLGGWIAHPGVRAFNLYRAPAILGGDARAATRWRDHLQMIYPSDAEHIERWLAFKLQNPGLKINHAIVLGGEQGIGKDTVLEAVKRGVGPWNWQEISPPQLLGRFNGWAKSVIVRLNEARDLGEFDRFAFYEHCKPYIAAPPDVLRVDEKNLREHYVVNVLGLIITTNHRTDGIYLPADDRRHFVAWSEMKKEDFSADYWSHMWRWYESGGFADVAAYLRGIDLRTFDPKTPPPRTAAFEAIVAAGFPQEDGDLLGLVEAIGLPPAITIGDLYETATNRNQHDVAEMLIDRKTRPKLPHVLDRIGYVAVPNPDAPSAGKWKVGDRYVPIYALKSLSRGHQIDAAKTRAKRGA